MTTGSVQLVDRDHRVRLHTNRVEKNLHSEEDFIFIVHSNQISSTNDDDFFTEKIWFKKWMKLYDFSLIINKIIKSKSLVLIFPSFNNLVTLKYDPKEGKSQLVWTNPTGSHVCLHDERRCCDQTALNANRHIFFFYTETPDLSRSAVIQTPTIIPQDYTQSLIKKSTTSVNNHKFSQSHPCGAAGLLLRHRASRPAGSAWNYSKWINLHWLNH